MILVDDKKSKKTNKNKAQGRARLKGPLAEGGNT